MGPVKPARVLIPLAGNQLAAKFLVRRLPDLVVTPDMDIIHIGELLRRAISL